MGDTHVNFGGSGLPHAATSTDSFAVALKEWSLLCDILAQGQQAILLRKGGVYESAGEFELEHRRFLLYPTVVHQNPDMLKPEYAPRVTPATREPEKIVIHSWANVFWITPVPDRMRMDRLNHLHIWNEKLLDMRFNYRPNYPLYLVLLDVRRLAQPVELPMHDDYIGCRSWVELKEPLTVGTSEAVHAPAALREIQDCIMRLFA